MVINDRQSTIFNQNNFLQVVLDDKGNIFKVDFWNNTPTQIGVIKEKYDEAIKIAEEFEKKLVELGIIQKEKSPEEIQKENNNLLNQLLEKFNNINTRLELLENNKLEGGEAENEQDHNKKYTENSSKQIKPKSR